LTAFGVGPRCSSFCMTFLTSKARGISDHSRASFYLAAVGSIPIGKPVEKRRHS
jgi:hypothetical protein